MQTVLLTGSTGYIGRRLIPILLTKGYKLICPVRDSRRFDFEDFEADELANIEVIECDLGNAEDYKKLPKNIDWAYYLVHSLVQSSKGFESHETMVASHFKNYIETTSAQQIVYLSGIVNDDNLSKHLRSRKNVEDVLHDCKIPLTVLRAGIVIGSGSASFEIIRDLVEKLPVMIAPKWVNSRCQPIGIANALEYLIGVLGKEKAYFRSFDIGGTDVLTYKEMLLGYARARKLKRWIITVPVLTPKLSSKWLYFVTSTSYSLAGNLVDSLKNDAVCENSNIDEIVKIDKHSYPEALERTLRKIRYGEVVSSWKDSFHDSDFNQAFLKKLEAPEYGCFVDFRKVPITQRQEKVIDNIWKIGGEHGWYYASFLWGIRGFLDKLVGGVGLRRGRRSPTDLKRGDALDFWRVLDAEKARGRLLLYAEMKLPGEAWLEFKIKNTENSSYLEQTATFRPRGIFGRLYWYAVFPFHLFIFQGMAERIVRN